MKVKKILYWFLGLLFLTISIITIYVFQNAQNIIEELIRKEIIQQYNESDDTDYLITLDQINIHLLKGSFQFKNLKVTPKNELVTFKRSIDGKALEDTFFTIYVAEISLTGFDFLKAINHRVIIADRFQITKPIIDIYQYQGIEKTPKIKQDTVDIRSIFLSEYDTFRIEEIHIQNATTSLHHISTNTDTTAIFTLQNMSYKITGVIANTTSLYSEDYFYFDQYFLKSKNIDLMLPSGTSIHVKSLDYQSDLQSLSIRHLAMKPGTTPSQFFKKQRYRKSWIKFNLDRLDIDSLDIKSWILNKELRCSLIKLDKPILVIHSNPNLAVNPEITKPMLGQVIQSIAVPFYVRTLEVHKAEINLDILAEDKIKHGKIKMHQMSVSAQNITNIDSEIQINPHLKIQSKLRINRTGLVDVNLDINLSHPRSTTRFKMHAKNLELNKFNTVLMPLLHVSISSGKMISLRTNATLNTQGVTGSQIAHYENLKIKLQSKTTNKSSEILHQIGTGIANGIVKSNNIPGKKSFHTGRFQFPKEKDHSFFKLLWLANLHGLKDSVMGSDVKDARKQQKKDKRKQEESKWKLPKKQVPLGNDPTL